MLAVVCRQLGSGSPPTVVVGQAGMLALPVAVLAIARRREGTPWAALGLRRPDIVTVVGGLALAANGHWVVAPLMFWVLRVTGSAGVAPTLSQLPALPLCLPATSRLSPPPPPEL